MKNDTMKLNFLAGVQVGNDVYFSAWDMNGLFKYHPESEECDFLKSFQGEEDWGLHSEAILYRNTIWFIPRASERIAIVDLTTLDIKYLELPECGHRPKGHIPPIRMRGYYKSGENFLFLIPLAYNLFIKIDMDKGETVHVENWGGDEYARAIGVMKQDKLIVYINCSNKMREINVLTGAYTEKKMDDKKDIYQGIQYIGENVLLFPVHMQDGIVSLHQNDDRMEIIQLEDDGQWYYEYQALICDDDILLIPYDGTKGVRISMEEERCIIKEFKDLGVQNKVYCSKKINYNDEIWYLSHVLENPIICYEKQKDIIRHRNLEITRKKYNEDIVESIAKYGISDCPLSDMNMIYEHKFLLDTFLQFMKGQNFREQIVSNNRVGETIYETLII